MYTLCLKMVFKEEVSVFKLVHKLYIENLPKNSAQVHLSLARLNLHASI